jgi:pSer/pThr/pTyr-binding forkhead associated (FHA) protein
MESSLGKLIMIQPGEPEKEFALGKRTVSLGRAMTNDIIVGDARASRCHANLEHGLSGWKITDLGSSNGTRVNGNRVQMADLKPGDLISLGNTQLRYQASMPSEEIALTMIDSEEDLELTLERENLPMSINETRHPRLVILSRARTWEIPLDGVDQVTIGRDDSNQVVLEHPKVSRQHAEVVRKGSTFVLRDLGSTNGTWLRGEAVSELALKDGDAFRIGEAQLVYKGGFRTEALTMAVESLVETAARRPVVFVPGMMGSELWLGNERVWPNVKVIFKDPDLFRYPSPVPLEPRAVVDQVVIVPNLIKQDQYNRLGDYLVEELGYERGKDFFEFAYDWRQDVRISARQLGQMIDALPLSQPLILIGHSLGTLVSRYYVKVLGGDRHVERLVLMGGPHRGAVKGLTSLLVAPEILPFGLLGERFRQIMATFPSSYQIIPGYPCAVDQHGNQINFLEDEGWAPDEAVPLLRAARSFRQELGQDSNVPAISIFGYGIKTIATVSLRRSPTGQLSDITYRSEPSGDSSVLESSAVLPNTEIHPVQQYHGSLFVDNDVKMRLKLELARPSAG